MRRRDNKERREVSNVLNGKLGTPPFFFPLIFLSPRCVKRICSQNVVESERMRVE